MMGYLDRLKGINSEKCPPSPLPKPPKAPYGSYDSSQGGRFQKIAPPEQVPPTPARACSTCAHACRSGCCGEPVAAGLSDLPGVIRYHAHQGAGCLAWLATLDGGLERRILAMAERWGYSGDDLALTLGAARSDPEGWRRVVETDERGQ